ncbi:DUF1249 domain-containing protein [Parvicella tangerina]|uniref:DUF6908 domain-containing protein n=1 Tax=Parvicella tangerina TaxID=2829795 RepID=A0A916JSA9_9FLAO|nr:DUF1249 domain-containing protein [Parvicella tangerina]CAG5086813.1 hypothetical protein CRYO30217_03291 [Parvicella tangerina]
MSNREISSYSTKELLTKWASLAKFIQHYEGKDWDEAKKKARTLFEDKDQTLAYIESKRSVQTSPPPSKKVQKEVSTPDPSTNQPETKPKSQKKKVKKPTKRDLPSQNYQKLIKVAPDIEERLLDGQEVYGKSKVAGFMDFVLEWVYTEKEGVYHLAITHYQEMNGDLVPDPDMRVLFDINQETLEPLSYQDFYRYQEVYEDIFSRDRISMKLRSSLNQFLKTWLSNLANQGHKIVWKHNQAPEKVSPVLEVVKDEKEESEQVIQKEDLSQKKRQDTRTAKALFKEFYKKLTSLFPNIVEKLKSNEVDGVFSNSKDETYDLVPAESKSKFIKRFGINENKENGASSIISVNVRNQRAWLTFAEKGLVDVDSAYSENDHRPLTEKNNQANTTFIGWLVALELEGYKIKWNEKEELAPNSPQKEGEVQLTNRHIKEGFKQKHIDWINKHRKGLLLVPRTKKIINNTKSIEDDLSKKAMRAGKRISRTGVIYYEGRSNRADVSRHGF